MSRLRPPVRRSRSGYVVDIGTEEAELVRRLLGELRGLLDEVEATPTDQPVAPHLKRLFPNAHADDDELEAEYQRLMREELVASRRSAIDAVEQALDGRSRLDEHQLLAFVRSINAVRLVLGTMLGVDDDPDRPEVSPGAEQSPEYHLYGYLSWLLEWSVRALSGS